jgi:hypothetical protein
MKRLGFFLEMSGSRPGDPSLKDGRDSAATSTTKADATVITYLDACPIVMDVMESEDCLLGCGAFLSGSATLISDGEWVWRADLRHYASKHGIELPAEFCAQAKVAPPPKVLNVEEMKLARQIAWGASGA